MSFSSNQIPPNTDDTDIFNMSIEDCVVEDEILERKD